MAGSKNTSHWGDRQKKGRLSEELVCRFLLSRGHRILARNKEFYHTEVDIFFETGPGARWIVEVKTLDNLDYLESVVGPKQKRRLRLVANALSDSGRAVGLILAVVNPRTFHIRWLKHFFD